MDMWMPIEPSAIGVDGAKHTNIQPSGSGGVLQVIHGQAAQGIKQLTVMKKQWPQRVRQGEDQVLPGTIG